MALTFNFDNCVNSSELDGNDPLTKTVIFLTMAVGINHIKEDNVEEFFLRVRLIEEMFGEYQTNISGKSFPFKFEQLQRYIGLKTNVSSLTRPQFIRNQQKYWIEDKIRGIRSEIQRSLI